MKIGRTFIFLTIIIPFMTIVSIYIYFEYAKTKDEVFNIIKEHIIDEKLVLCTNYFQHIVKRHYGNIKDKVFTDKESLNDLENELRLIQGNEIKYMYLLYKDKDGYFRYLLDATQDKNERAEQNQRFNTQSDIWDKAYQTKKYQVAYQNQLQTLWVTIAYPLVMDNKVIAVLGADFTYGIYDKIMYTLKPMEKIFLYIAFFMLIMLILAYILTYLYYKIRKKAIIDPLTQVYNRQYLPEFLETTSLKDFYLMMIDLDKFKLINDNYGHDAGDEVLIAVVSELKSKIRQKDILIRFGGEEFLLFVFKKELHDSFHVADRLRESIEKLTIKTKTNIIHMTISIGINPLPYGAKNIEEAIKIADEQLYIAKSSGRNRVQVFREKDSYQSKTLNRITDIQHAIDEKKVRCAFQPIYSSTTNNIEKYEMLIRLIDQEDRIVFPNEFLPSIRHTQIYINLTNIVLDKAIEVLKSHDFNLSINLDLQDILNEDIIDLLQNLFINKKDFANRITIEILEHEEISDFELIQKNLTLLKDMGFYIALDDFGSGYANFRYLINLDIDILKLDGTIIKNIDKDEMAYSVVKAIVAFTKNMDMKVVAEQVETKEEFDIVKELGVDYIQGYYLGRPEMKF